MCVCARVPKCVCVCVCVYLYVCVCVCVCVFVYVYVDLSPFVLWCLSGQWTKEEFHRRGQQGGGILWAGGKWSLEGIFSICASGNWTTEGFLSCGREPTHCD